MRIQVNGIVFDRAAYDHEADVLYLSAGDPINAVHFEESAEGHALRYDEQGRLIGISIVNARALLQMEGAIVVTPPQLRVELDQLSSLLSPA